MKPHGAAQKYVRSSRCAGHLHSCI